MKNNMTTKERWIAAVKMEPVDRLPFWPKIFNNSYSLAQAPPFNQMTPTEIQNWIGSDNHVYVMAPTRMDWSPGMLEVSNQDGKMQAEFSLGEKTLEITLGFDIPSQSWYPITPLVKTIEDVKVLREIITNVQIEIDKEKLEANKALIGALGNDGVTGQMLGESPLMLWVEYLAGVETGHILLHDHSEEVEALFDVIHQKWIRQTELMVESSPCDFLYFIENTSTTLISPSQYQKYCLGHVTDYANICRDGGRDLILHMCGHLKALLPILSKVPAQAFEAFTSPPVGNTTLLDGRTAAPDKALIGGTNAALWMKPATEIISEIEEHLDQLPHHRGIVVSTAGVIPPMAKPETVKQVCDWVHAYPAKM